MIDQENIQEQEVEETEQEQQIEEDTQKEDLSENDTHEAQAIPQETESDRNFKELREKVKRAERERDEAFQVIKQIEQAYYQNQSKQQKQPEDDISYNDDDILEGRHLKKELTSIRKQLEEYKKESTERAVESKITSMYPDFYDVVTTDNIKSLREMDPYLADSLHANPDMMSKAISTYRQIKNLGIVPRESYDPHQQQTKSNTTKPRSTASISPQEGDSPLARANAFSNGLTPELKAQLYKEMQEKARGW